MLLSMAILQLSDGRRAAARSHHLFGRSASMTTVLADASVSGRHAALWWTPEGWRLQDLGSRNGTRVDGEPLGPGEARRMVAGDRFELGDGVLITLETDGPPAPAAEDRWETT